MQKFFKRAALLLAVMTCVSMYSCKDKDNDEVVDPTAPITPVEPSAKDAMSAEAQKEYLEKVAIELAEKMPASDFNSLFAYLQQLSKHLGQYSDKNISTWSREALKSMTTVLSSGEYTEKTSTTNADHITYYSYSTTKNVLTLSAFTGHFTIEDKAWVYEEASDLQFNFVDQDGKKCVIKLETSGDVKTVHAVTEIDADEYSTGFDRSGEKPVSTKYDNADTTFQYVSLPEKVKLTFNRDGLTLASMNCTFKLSDLEGEEFIMNKSNLSCTAALELVNGYKVEVVNLNYKAEKKLTAALRLSKNKEALVTLTLNTGLKFPTVAFSDLDMDPETYEEEKQTTYWVEEAKLDAFTLKLDILGKVQVQGVATEFIEFYNLLDDVIYDFNVTDGESFKNAAEDLNHKIDCGIFYNGKNAKQADIKMAAFNNGTEESEKWTLIPVIKFADGTSYGDMTSFFSAENFGKAIEAWYNLIGEYKNLGKEQNIK